MLSTELFAILSYIAAIEPMPSSLNFFIPVESSSAPSLSSVTPSPSLAVPAAILPVLVLRVDVPAASLSAPLYALAIPSFKSLVYPARVLAPAASASSACWSLTLPSLRLLTPSASWPEAPLAPWASWSTPVLISPLLLRFSIAWPCPAFVCSSPAIALSRAAVSTPAAL